jgi:hypothetical protein
MRGNINHHWKKNIDLNIWKKRKKEKKRGNTRTPTQLFCKDDSDDKD